MGPQLFRKARILAAAATLFEERGYLDVRMSDIAAVSGVTKMTVYQHFATKEALYLSVLRRWMSALPPSPVLPGFRGNLRQDLKNAAQCLLEDASHPLCRRFSVALLTPPAVNSPRPLRFWLARRARATRALELLLTKHNFTQPYLAAQQFMALLLTLLDVPTRCNALSAPCMPPLGAVDDTVTFLVRAHCLPLASEDGPPAS